MQICILFPIDSFAAEISQGWKMRYREKVFEYNEK